MDNFLAQESKNIATAVFQGSNLQPNDYKLNAITTQLQIDIKENHTRKNSCRNCRNLTVKDYLGFVNHTKLIIRTGMLNLVW